MLWLAFGCGGKFNVQVVEERMNAVQYQRLLTQANIVESGVMIGGEQLIFQQDNAPPHSASYFLTFHLSYCIFNVISAGEKHLNVVYGQRYSTDGVIGSFSLLASGPKYVGNSMLIENSMTMLLI